MTRKIWLDISGYQQRPDPNWFDSLPALGVEGMLIQLYGGQPGIFSLGPNVDAEYQLAQSRRVGLDTGGYMWLPPQLSVSRIWSEAVAAAGVEFKHLLFGSLDIEGNYAHGDTRLLAAYSTMLDSLWPRPISVYTSGSQWQHQGNTTVLRAVPLHEAWYLNSMPQQTAVEELKQDAYFDVKRGLPFGGWQNVGVGGDGKGRAMWQFFGGHANGVGADWNIIDYERMGIKSQEDNMPLTDEDIQKVVNAVRADRESDTQRVYVEHKGSVYILTEDQELVHVVNPEVMGAQDPAWDVTHLAKDSLILKLRTIYPAGVPLLED